MTITTTAIDDTNHQTEGVIEPPTPNPEVLTKNDVLVDGIKRFAWLSTIVFCDLNDHFPQLTDDEAFQLVCDIARSQLDVGRFTERLRLE